MEVGPPVRRFLDAVLFANEREADEVKLLIFENCTHNENYIGRLAIPLGGLESPGGGHVEQAQI